MALNVFEIVEIQINCLHRHIQTYPQTYIYIYIYIYIGYSSPVINPIPLGKRLATAAPGVSDTGRRPYMPSIY